MILNKQQEELLLLLENTWGQLQSALWEVKIPLVPGLLVPGFMRKNFPKHGVYIFGSVGSGKTTIMRRFYQDMVCAKGFFHYQELIKIIHKNSQVNYKKLEQFTNLLGVQGCKLLCIDEVDIGDPADAVIFAKLLQELNAQHTFVILSSNFHPHDFNKKVLNPVLVNDLSQFIQQNYIYNQLSCAVDYMRQKGFGPKILFPKNEQNIAKFQAQIAALISGRKIVPHAIENFSRAIKFQHTCGSILFSDFDELCRPNFSYTDYISICKNFQTIIIKNVPQIASQDKDILLRFINLIDSIYFNRINLYALFELEPHLIYMGIKHLEFDRCISRLFELSW